MLPLTKVRMYVLSSSYILCLSPPTPLTSLRSSLVPRTKVREGEEDGALILACDRQRGFKEEEIEYARAVAGRLSELELA